MISDLDQDDFGYPVNIEQVTYVTRQLADDTSVDLPMWVFTPGVDNMPEGAMPEGGWPVIVFVRGSAFHEQNVTDYSNYFVRIAEQGYVVAALKYRHSDIAPFPAQMQDCKTAVRFMRKNATLPLQQGSYCAVGRFFGRSYGVDGWVHWQSRA